MQKPYQLTSQLTKAKVRRPGGGEGRPVEKADTIQARCEVLMHESSIGGEVLC